MKNVILRLHGYPQSEGLLASAVDYAAGTALNIAIVLLRFMADPLHTGVGKWLAAESTETAY